MHFSKTTLLLLLLVGIFEPLFAKTLTKKLPLLQDSLNLLKWASASII